jgi:hypothetical protein
LNTNAWNPTDFERFVEADTVAEFLSITRREVLRLTRQGVITGFPISGKLRKTYKYRLSMIAEEMMACKKSVLRISRIGGTANPLKDSESYA